MLKKLSSIETNIRTQPSSTSTPITKFGAVGSISLNEQEKTTAVTNLINQNPFQVESQLRLQIQSDLSYKVEFNERYDSHHGKVILTSVDIDNDNLEQLNKALLTVTKSLMPLSDEELIERLTVMMAVQNKQNMKEDDLTLKIKSLIQLINYQDQIPADIIVHAINYLTRNSPWYPAYSDIRERCSHMHNTRIKMRDALHKRINLLAFDNKIMHK